MLIDLPCILGKPMFYSVFPAKSNIPRACLDHFAMNAVSSLKTNCAKYLGLLIDDQLSFNKISMISVTTLFS